MRFIVQLFVWIRKFSDKIARDRMDAYSAQAAFFVIMGFIPFVMLLLTMLQYTPMTEQDMMSLLNEIFPQSFHSIVQGAVSSVYTKSSALISGTVIAAIWACSKAMLSVANGLNTIYGTNVEKNYIIARIRAAIYILLLLLAFVLAIGLFVFGNLLHDYLMHYLPWLRTLSWLIISARTIGTILLLSLVFCAMYAFLPYTRRDFFAQMPGAVVAAFAWSIFSYAFTVYIEYSREMSAIYGSLTTIVMVMLWLYICMWLLFFGAEVNCYLEEPEKF